MKYDKSLFASTTDYYTEYRPEYPQIIFDKIVSMFKPDKNDVVLDLGCGTGEVTLPLAKYSGKILAWDPDGEMLKIARRKAKKQGVTNVTFEQKSSDDLPTLTQKIKLVVMGQSFHWMGGTSTLEEIKKHLTEGGGISIIGIKCGIHVYNPDGWVEPIPVTAERNRTIYDLVMKHLGIKRRAGKTTFKTSYQPYTDMLNEVGFYGVTEQMFNEIGPRSVDETLGYIYTTTWGNKNQLGDRSNTFEQELREGLRALKPDGVFDEKITFSLLTAKLSVEDKG